MAWQALLAFWFGELVDGFADATHRKRWFAGGPAFDAELTERFSPLIEAALAGTLDDWLDKPQSRLAYVLVTDQLTRNVHRGTPKAFAGDALALAAAADAVASGVDAALQVDERCFLYMPFEHSESLVDQHTCVGLFGELLASSPGGADVRVASYLDYAHEHRDIIRRFGRFPHRNALLGRTSTAAEQEFLASGKNFGQASS